MSKVIRVKFDTQDTIDSLRKYRQNFINVMNDIMDDICQTIVRDSQALYGRHVTVTRYPVKTDGGQLLYRVEANGKPVVFLEFGAGYTVDNSTIEAQVFYENSGVLVELGSFSASADGTGEFIRTHIETGGHGYWTLANGVRIDHVEPRRALHLAIESALASMQRIVDRNNEKIR